MRNRWAGAITAGMLGLAIGAWWSPRGAPSEDSATPVAASSPSAEPLQEEPRQSINPETPAPAPSPVEVSAHATRSPLEEAKTLVRLNEEGVLHSSILVVEPTPEGGVRLSAALRKLLAVTPSEEAQITSAIQQAKERVSQIESELAQVGRGAPGGEEDGAVVISVPAFPERGGKLYDALYGTVAATLGPDRTALFDRLTGDYLEQAAGRLGAQERRIVIKRKPEMIGGNPVYEIRDQYTAGNNSGWSGGQSVGRESLNQRFGQLAKGLLPPDL